MKRKFLSVLLALLVCVCLTLCVSATTSDRDETGVLYDAADLLSTAEETALRAKLWELSGIYDAQIIVATVDSISGDIDTYVEYVYDTMGFGYGETRDGVLLLVCMDIREFRILSNGSAADAITLGAINRISDAIVDDLSDGNYAVAFDCFADRCAYYLEGKGGNPSFNGGKTLLIALIVGLVVGLAVALILKAQLKTVRKQNQADFYLKQDSLRITAQRDMFLYRDVRRTRKESSRSSGSSGGSSRNVGGRSF